MHNYHPPSCSHPTKMAVAHIVRHPPRATHRRVRIPPEHHMSASARRRATQYAVRGLRKFERRVTPQFQQWHTETTTYTSHLRELSTILSIHMCSCERLHQLVLIAPDPEQKRVAITIRNAGARRLHDARDQMCAAIVKYRDEGRFAAARPTA